MATTEEYINREEPCLTISREDRTRGRIDCVLFFPTEPEKKRGVLGGCFFDSTFFLLRYIYKHVSREVSIPRGLDLTNVLCFVSVC